MTCDEKVMESTLNRRLRQIANMFSEEKTGRTLERELHTACVGAVLLGEIGALCGLESSVHC